MQANVNRLCKAYGFVNEWYGFMNKRNLFWWIFLFFGDWPVIFRVK